MVQKQINIPQQWILVMVVPSFVPRDGHKHAWHKFVIFLYKNQTLLLHEKGKLDNPFMNHHHCIVL